jgi:MtN3 and saliva related transmembrane protein
MGLIGVVGTIAAICTTVAFIPQILKIRRQGGNDLSYPMLFLYLTGVLLWLFYGLLIHAAAVIWANAVTSLLVAAALVLKASHPASKHRSE